MTFVRPSSWEPYGPAYIKLGSIWRGGGQKNVDEGMQDVVVQAPSTSKGGRPASGMFRSASTVKRVKRGLKRERSECVRVTEDVDELSAMRGVSDKLRKFLFTESNRVSKNVIEFTLRCCSELEEQLMRVIAKNERLLGRFDECERQLREKDVRMSETFASRVKQLVCMCRLRSRM